MKIVFEFPAFLAEMRIRSDNSHSFIKEVFIMFQYERMASVLPGGREFAYCNNISLEDLQQELIAAYGNRNIPVAFARDKVKSGMLSSDPCLVVYHPYNLDFHVYVFVLRNVNGRMMLSCYSAGTAAAMHIGGGIANVENQKRKLKDVLKSTKQKQAEEEQYFAATGLAIDDTLISLGIFSEQDFSYRMR